MGSIEKLEAEVERLHSELEQKGVNSRGTKDIFGRTFAYPVNGEHKATVFFPILWSCKQPHMHTFWAATLGFFCTFFSCFAPGALGIYYKRPKPDGLELGGQVLSDAGAFAVTGTIVMRVLAGPMCDVFGARKTFAILLLIGIPGMIIFACAQDGAAFMLGRIIIGLSLATFVTCQVWCSQFFDRSIVGTVNATAGGWGNLGGGITLLTMPYIMEIFLAITGQKIGPAWRLCMIVPVVMHLGSTIFIMLARDLPDGSYKELEATGAKQKSKGGINVAILGFSNTNALIMLLTYGLCFGVELCMNNKLVPYFTIYYGMPPTIAGPLGACFSLMNLFARSWGGILSDWSNAKFGMRGRIASMWIVQTIEGLFCLLMGVVTLGLNNPQISSGYVNTKVEYEGVTYMFNGTGCDEISAAGGCIVGEKVSTMYGFMKTCGSDIIRPKDIEYAFADGVWGPFPLHTSMPDARLMAKDFDSPDCVVTSGRLGVTMLVMILFSLCVQMAEGLHFGIVPYISRPALGVVSGMVGAGGNTGALIATRYIIGKDGYGKGIDAGFINLGIVIMTLSLTMHFIYFPEDGGILLPKGCGYNPQLIKESAGSKGSDELDFSKKEVSVASA